MNTAINPQIPTASHNNKCTSGSHLIQNGSVSSLLWSCRDLIFLLQFLGLQSLLMSPLQPARNQGNRENLKGGFLMLHPKLLGRIMQGIQSCSHACKLKGNGGVIQLWAEEAEEKNFGEYRRIKATSQNLLFQLQLALTVLCLRIETSES